jgi:hypothetical protein
MDGYQRRPAGPTGVGSGGREIVEDAGAFLRRLIPFPEAGSISPLSLLAPAAPDRNVQAGAGSPAAAGAIAGQPAPSIVAQAASILDEEMAKGVIEARRLSDRAPDVGSEAGNPVLRQVHALVDQLAAVWPRLQGARVPPLSVSPSAGAADSLAEVTPRTSVRPGERATISMTVRNNESRLVHLIPMSTDLIGCRGGRMAGTLVELNPPTCTLRPAEERDLTISVTVPTDVTPGCYSGLLVVTGVDYLRALVTIDVV